MSAEFPDSSRHIFPRWRSFKTTTALGELAWSPTRSPSSPAHFDELLENQTTECRSDPTLWKSLDLLGTATIANRLGEFAELREWARQHPNTPEAARKFLGNNATDNAPNLANDIEDEASRRAEVRTHRHRLASAPNDPIEWVDLARALTTAGLNGKARKAIASALQLAPNNRFVLRSAARFYIHVGEPDLARALIARAPSTAKDPWLMASEIAISSSLGADSIYVRTARLSIESDIPPQALTELEAALGTLEAEGGRHRIARKLLRRSLDHPNENSVAQIRWLNRAHLSDAVDVSNAKPPLLHEANAKASLYSGSFETARDEAKLWLEDQPFASAPAVIYSYILAEIFLDWQAAQRVAEFGLISNPNDVFLLNNLAVCSMESGQLRQAEMIVNRMRTAEGTKPSPVHKATHGMLAFRTGNQGKGRELYLEAIEDARAQGLGATAYRAAMHLIIEELTAGSDQLQSAANRLSQLGNTEQPPDAKILRQRINEILSRRGKQEPSGERREALGPKRLGEKM